MVRSIISGAEPGEFAGLGIVNLTNALPELMLTRLSPHGRSNCRSESNQCTGDWPIEVVEHHALDQRAGLAPLRVTWSGPIRRAIRRRRIKLVNDLDLVVSNTVSGVVYYGNKFRTEVTLRTPRPPAISATCRSLNNVENVFINQPATSNLVVTVFAKRVNVVSVSNYEAVTGEAGDIVQDFALIISCGDTTLTNAFTVTAGTPAAPDARDPAGRNDQWTAAVESTGRREPLRHRPAEWVHQSMEFLVFTNTFITNDIARCPRGAMWPLSLSSRQMSACPGMVPLISISTSLKDPRLISLDPGVIDSAWKSLTRSGTETVVFTNALQGDVYYIGVKSEDQQGGEYGLIALSTDKPFDKNRNGSRVLQGLPVPQAIPDGSPAKPGRSTIFAIGLTPITVRRVTVENTLTHEDVGDLSVILSHERASAVLHNHTLNNGFFAVTNVSFLYDDEGFGHATPGVRHSDGPGDLTTFVGAVGSGVWIMDFIDNAPTHTGRVENVEITLDPFVDGNLAEFPPSGFSGTVAPHDTTCFFVDVPAQATNMVLTISQLDGPLQMYVREGAFPRTNAFDQSVPLAPPGGVFTLGYLDQPIPLQAGRYYVCLDNSGDAAVNFNIALQLQLGVGLDFERTLIGTNALTIPDPGTVTSTVNVPVDKQVAEVQVAVRIDHPRSSDLVLHLLSPEGTRVLLAENRGGNVSTGYGSGYGTNLTYSIFTEDTNLAPTIAPIKFSLPPWTNSATATNPLTFNGDFEGAAAGEYGLTQSLAGWSVSQGGVTVYGPGNPLGITAEHGTNFVGLGTTNAAGSILASFGTVPGRTIC